MNRTFAAIVISLSLAASPLIVKAEGAKPDATLEITGKTVGVGVGFTAATGTLYYQGKSYPVQMNGLSIAQAGAADMKAKGEVYHLDKLQDVGGTYASSSVGAALGDGSAYTTMKNDKGVVIKMHATTAGVDLRLSVDGVSLTLMQ